MFMLFFMLLSIFFTLPTAGADGKHIKQPAIMIVFAEQIKNGSCAVRAELLITDAQRRHSTDTVVSMLQAYCKQPLTHDHLLIETEENAKKTAQVVQLKKAGKTIEQLPKTFSDGIFNIYVFKPYNLLLPKPTKTTPMETD